MSPAPTLGTCIATRRNALNLSQSRAAKLAGVARTSWRAWEKGTVTPEEFNWSKIERVCQWEPGSVRAILSGGEPTELPIATVTALPTREDPELPPDDDFVRELRAMRSITPSHLEILIRAYWADRAQEEARVQEKIRALARAVGG